MFEVLMAQAVLGRDAEEFLNTELAKYVFGRAEQEKALAQEKLSKVSPWRKRRIQELQNEVWRAEALKDWFAELVSEGKAAEAQLEEENNEG